MQCFLKFYKIHVSHIEFFKGVVLLLVLHEGAYRSRASAAISTLAIAANIVCVVFVRY